LQKLLESDNGENIEINFFGSRLWSLNIIYKKNVFPKTLIYFSYIIILFESINFSAKTRYEFSRFTTQLKKNLLCRRRRIFCQSSKWKMSTFLCDETDLARYIIILLCLGTTTVLLFVLPSIVQPRKYYFL